MYVLKPETISPASRRSKEPVTLGVEPCQSMPKVHHRLVLSQGPCTDTMLLGKLLGSGRYTVRVCPWTPDTVYKSWLSNGVGSSESTTRIFSSGLQAQQASTPLFTLLQSLPPLHIYNHVLPLEAHHAHFLLFRALRYASSIASTANAF